MDADGSEQNDLRELRAELSRRRLEVTHLQREVRDLRASKSWRITAPLRRLDDLLHGRGQAICSQVERQVTRGRVSTGGNSRA